jgi:hypothetical protein
VIISRSMILIAAALALPLPSSDARACPFTIECMRACINAKLAVTPSLPESVGATMHRQPTRGSVAAAEERLAQISAHAMAAVAHGMRRARGRQCG